MKRLVMTLVILLWSVILFAPNNRIRPLSTLPYPKALRIKLDVIDPLPVSGGWNYGRLEKKS